MAANQLGHRWPRGCLAVAVVTSAFACASASLADCLRYEVTAIVESGRRMARNSVPYMADVIAPERPPDSADAPYTGHPRRPPITPPMIPGRRNPPPRPLLIS